MKVIHATRDTELEFDKGTTPEWGVAYAYCEENGLLSWLFKHAQDLTLDIAYKILPLDYGNITVFCGDWIARTK